MNGLVVVLANLKARKLAGMESNGMVLIIYFNFNEYIDQN